ncbi:MAG: hypothetical protein ACOYN0_15515 [Phycisphaerales bacterium]
MEDEKKPVALEQLAADLADLKQWVDVLSSVVESLQAKLRTSGGGRDPASVLAASNSSLSGSSHHGIGFLIAEPNPVPEIEEMRQTLIIATYNREIEKLRESRSELFYTNWIGRMVFVVVHGVLFMALYIAWKEFVAANKKRARAATETNEISFSMEGVALKTALHGVLLIGFALAFYFLYLKFVYPINVIHDVSASPAAPAAPA